MPVGISQWILLVVCLVVGGLLGAMANHAISAGHWHQPAAGLLLAALIIAVTHQRRK